MIAAEFLNLLHRPRKCGNGWTARCPVPAHDDRSPSLSIREGDKGILVKCWAGCTVDEICSALSIQARDLFYEQRYRKEIRRQTEAKRTKRDAVNRFKAAQADLLREAEAVIRAATGVDISEWSNEELDRAITAVCRARKVLIEEEQKEWMTV